MSIENQALTHPWTVTKNKKGETKLRYHDVPMVGRIMALWERRQATLKTLKEIDAEIEAIAGPASRKVTVTYGSEAKPIIPAGFEPVFGYYFGKLSVAAVHESAVTKATPKAAESTVTGWDIAAETPATPDKPGKRK